jgi:hypothetical protein
VSRDINGMDVVVSRLPDISRELVGVDSHAPAPAAPQQAQPPQQPQSPAAAPPAAAAPPVLAPADEMAQKNKNRFGIRIGFNAFIGETWWYWDTAGHTRFDSALNKSFDTIISQPVMLPNLKLIIPCGPLLSLEIGGGYAFWGQHFAFQADPSSGMLANQVDFSNSYLALELGLNFVERWYPFKLNVGLAGGYNFFSSTNKFEYRTTDGVTTSDTTYDFKPLDLTSQGISFGGRVGVEIMAGSHIGFNFDFLPRYCVFMTKLEDKDPATGLVTAAYNYKIQTPWIGVGTGLNIYF